jgi:hypothetical protein
MREHGKGVEISPTHPRAKAVCDRCGMHYNHHKLKWAVDWRGTKLQNLRMLVCDSCLDAYQQNGQRTILLPPDPVPIHNARPENYVANDNPLSALGANPNPLLNLYSAQIGTMRNAAGIPAAFDGNTNKPSFMSAMITTVDSSYGNYVGINWAGYPGGTFPTGLDTPVITHTLASYALYAPNDSTFGSTSYVVQGSPFGDVNWGSWTTLSSGNFVGAIGEVATGTVNVGQQFQFHRVGFWGGGGFSIAVAQVQFNVADEATMTTS